MVDTNPFGPEEHHEPACTTTPERDCHGIEICGSSPCRVARPERRIPCGPRTCSGKTPICRYEYKRQIALGCIAEDDETIVNGEPYSVACTTPRDCPKGARCWMRYWRWMPSFCTYGEDWGGHGYSAVVCSSDADCAEGIHCVVVKGDPAHRRACADPTRPRFW